MPGAERMTLDERGLVFIELLVVILILAILFGISLFAVAAIART